MHQIAEHIHRLGGKRHNFYIVTEGGRATVIDAGGSKEYPALQRALAALGLGLDAIEAVLITHAHTDHIGFARKASEDGISVKVHEGEAAYARDRSQGSQIGAGDVPLWKPRVLLFLAEMVRVGAHRGRSVPNVETARDGEVLDLPGRPTVIATPGHTAGHAAYLLGDRTTLFSGDSLVTNGIIGGPDGPQILKDRFHHDPSRARDSVQILGRLGTELLLPGHGEPWRGPIADAVSLAL